MYLPKRDPNFILPLNKNGRFSIKASKTDLHKISDIIEPADKYQRRIGKIAFLFVVFGIVAIFVLTVIARTNAQIVPANDMIYAPAGASGFDFFNFGSVYPNRGKISQPFATTTVDQALCAIDTQLSNGGFGAGGFFVTAELYRDGPQSGTRYWPAPSRIESSDLQTGFGATTTFVFDPCVTLRAGKQYWITFDMDPQWPLGTLSRTDMSSVGSSDHFWYLDESIWKRYPDDIALNIYAYGFSSLAGVDEPVSSDYGFSTGSALGTDLGASGGYLADLFKYLLIPSTDAINGFQANKTLLFTKIPIGYFTVSKSAFLGLTTSTASSTILTLKTSLGSINFWDTSTTQHSLIWQGMSPWLFGFERVGMWMGFLFYLYVRARDFIV